MGHNLFRSYRPDPATREWSEAEIVALARQLLEEHATARAAAITQHNLVCGECRGAGNVESSLAPGEFLTCWCCAGTGKPNDKVQAPPALTAEDTERMWKLSRLVKGQHGAAVLQVIREYFPDMYGDAQTKAAN